jgi:hypothetical protein
MMAKVISGVLACVPCSRDSGMTIEIPVPELPSFPTDAGRTIKIPISLKAVLGTTEDGEGTTVRLSCGHLTNRQPLSVQEYLVFDDNTRIEGAGIPFLAEAR